MIIKKNIRRTGFAVKLLVFLVPAVVTGAFVTRHYRGRDVPAPAAPRAVAYEPRVSIDTSGFALMLGTIPPWAPSASLREIAAKWGRPGLRLSLVLDDYAKKGAPDLDTRIISC